MYLLILPPFLSKKSIRNGELSWTQRLSQVFQNSNFLLKAWTFINGNKYYQLTSFEIAKSLLLFLSKYLPNTQVQKNHSLSINLSSKKCVPWKEGVVLLSPWTDKCLFWRQPWYFSMQQKCFLSTYFVTHNIKQTFDRLLLDKITNKDRVYPLPCKDWKNRPNI